MKYTNSCSESQDQVSGPWGYQQRLNTCSHHHLHLSGAQESHFYPVWNHPSLIQWCCHKCQSVREWAACTVPWQQAGRAGKNSIPWMYVYLMRAGHLSIPSVLLKWHLSLPFSLGGVRKCSADENLMVLCCAFVSCTLPELHLKDRP